MTVHSLVACDVTDNRSHLTFIAFINNDNNRCSVTAEYDSDSDSKKGVSTFNARVNLFMYTA